MEVILYLRKSVGVAQQGAQGRRARMHIVAGGLGAVAGRTYKVAEYCVFASGWELRSGCGWLGERLKVYGGGLAGGVCGRAGCAA